MIPQKKETNYEKVKVGEMLPATIKDIEYDMEHKRIWNGQESIYQACRFVFDIDGYEHNHYSNWMTFSYHEKSNLLNTYLYKLVEGIAPDSSFELDNLKGMRVKTVWAEKQGKKGIFQFIDSIWPLNGKYKFIDLSDLDKQEPPQQEVDLNDDSFDNGDINV